MNPKRIQLSRRKGWRMPENTVKVDRSTRWGNPFVRDKKRTKKRCVESFIVLLMGYTAAIDEPSMAEQDRYRKFVAANHKSLRGKNLGCWCKLCPEHTDGLPLGVKCDKCAPCHADVLLEVANR